MSDKVPPSIVFPSGGGIDFRVVQPEEVPVRHLVESGACTPSCLLAVVDDGACQCRCDGTFHGIAADLVVNVERDAPIGAASVPIGDIKARNQALRMMDECPACAARSVRPRCFYPFKWGSDGMATYQCDLGHHWQCSWPISTPGRAPYFRGVVAE